MERAEVHEDLRQIVSEALSVVSELPVALQPVAFGKAFEYLATEHCGSTLRTGIDQKSSLGMSPRNGAKRARSATGPKQLCQQLLDRGFFDELRPIEAVVDNLKLNHARVVESKDIATSVARLVREGKLRREKNSEGKYAYQRA